MRALDSACEGGGLGCGNVPCGSVRWWARGAGVGGPGAEKPSGSDWFRDGGSGMVREQWSGDGGSGNLKCVPALPAGDASDPGALGPQPPSSSVALAPPRPAPFAGGGLCRRVERAAAVPSQPNWNPVQLWGARAGAFKVWAVGVCQSLFIWRAMVQPSFGNIGIRSSKVWLRSSSVRLTGGAGPGSNQLPKRGGP
eukprot:gene22220-biopygen14750